MANPTDNWCRSFISDWLHSYATVKQVEIKKTYVGTIHRILQVAVVIYILIYVVLIKKGYQDIEEPRGSSVIKVKGVARVSTGNSNFNANNVKQSFWDAAEYLIPPIENNAFFIATRKTVTYNQISGTCPTALSDGLLCNSINNPCKQGIPAPNSFGFLTGKCVPTRKYTRTNVCEINAWCPQELSKSTDYKINIDDLQNFTVFIKTIVVFTQYDIKIRTVKDYTNFSCRFNKEIDQRCPMFSIGYILQNLQDQDSKINLTALYHQGGLIEIQENWKCSFDFDKKGRKCFPKFKFNLLQSGSDELSPGINYRFAEKYNVNGVEYRTLTKVYGLRFVLTIRGKGRRFDIVRLFIAIGSGVGYMIIAEIICEFIFMTFHKYRKEYRQNKVEICHLKQSSKTDTTKLPTTITNLPLTQPLILSQATYQSAVS